jgi:cell division initiation protein
MKLDPDDIQEQTFPKKFLGFDKKEVSIFLQLLATEFQELISENILLKKQIEEKQKENEFLIDTREEVNEILKIIQQFSRESIEMAYGNDLFQKQLMKKVEDATNTIDTIDTEIKREIANLVVNIEGLENKITETGKKEIGFTTKDDIQRLLEIAKRIKEEEIDTAEEEATKIISEAEQEADEIRTSIQKLKDEYRLLQQKMEEAIKSHLNLIRPIHEEEKEEQTQTSSTEQGFSAPEN